jgi:glycosyltransferase involved in cell wall biosynthesis
MLTARRLDVSAVIRHGEKRLREEAIVRALGMPANRRVLDGRGVEAPRMRVLTFTSLYPSSERPRHGIFVEARLSAMQRVCQTEVHVVAPVPAFAFRWAGRSLMDRELHEETRLGNRVMHPRYWSPPGVAMYVQPWTMAAAGLRSIRQLESEGVSFDVIDAHYLYPDGVAAAMISRRLGRPLVLTARGSDVNRLAEFAWPRRLIGFATREAAAVVTVSEALSVRLRALGVPGDKLVVIPNGVDLTRFALQDRTAARRKFSLPDGPLVMSCGNLVPEKGHDLALDALAALPDVHLIVVGAGRERDALARRATANGVAKRVRFLGEFAQSELAGLYAAVDVVVLASSREGMPNVLLEAMACGTPVVASAVGGVPEIVTDPVAGRLVHERTASGFARALRELLDAPRDPARTRRFAERFDWGSSARAHHAVLRQASGAVAPEMPCAAC